MQKIAASFAAAFFAALALTANQASAEPNPPANLRAKMPTSMRCTPTDAKALPPGHEAFFITDLNSADKEPSANIDGDAQGFEIDGERATFDFNNGCDDDYDFTFYRKDLEALAQGTLQQAVGLLKYFNAYGDDPATGYGNEGTTLVTCSLNN